VSETSAGVSGIIFDIQRFSVHDGPGIRTLVFFKGCPLACLWCSNPESQRFDPELLFDLAKCVACGGCVEACPHGAVRLDGERLQYDRERCIVCGRCVEVCYAEARTMAGRQVTADEVVGEILKDAPFFANSGGGVTLGGGEPLAQPDFARQVLALSRRHGINTAIETCGHVPWGLLESFLPWTDLFLYDLKHVALILANLERLIGAGAPAIVRVPVIPGFNDTAEDIRAIARQVARLGIVELHLLPYHRLGQNKYRLAGRRYEFAGGDPAGDAAMASLRDVAAHLGLSVTIGG
jgi:pyruvate formate lyase activating enzyme